MYLTTLMTDVAVGHILCHNVADDRGRKAFAKGHRLGLADLPRLQALGVQAVDVAVLEPDDVHENEAARRLAGAVIGPGIVAMPPSAGRVNLLAAANGVVMIDVDTLLEINLIEGLTVATLPTYTPVGQRKRIATIKIIPFGMPQGLLEQAEVIGRQASPITRVQPYVRKRIGLILVGSAAARPRIEGHVYPAIRERIEALGSVLQRVCYVTGVEHTIATAITDQVDAGAELLIIAGETSIMDRGDVIPRGIALVGGHIEHYGAPVEPGNLLLLAYLNDGSQVVPIIGAPGCVRSRDLNLVDLLLPRLLAGEHLTKRAIVTLGHGGLLAGRS